ncbi:MAG: hypothetical protein IPP71_07045 [Bacteroidetes bacterium]|nr:hypothetical protein [Bacteroidota bacterium]
MYPIYQNISFFDNDFALEMFEQKLAFNKEAGNKNILVLGTLSDYSSDIHQTVFGKTHGVSFLINTLIALQKKHHHQTVTAFLFLLVVLSIFILSVSCDRIRKKIKHFFSDIFDFSTNKLNKAITIKIKNFTKNIVSFILVFEDELVALFLLVVLYCIYALFHTIPNIFLVLFIFYINTKVHKHVKNQLNKSTKAPQ